MNRGKTDKFLVSRVLTAAFVLLVNDYENHKDVNEMVLGRAGYLLTKLWGNRFKKLRTHRYGINEFWRRVKVQVERSPDLHCIEIIHDQTVNPPGKEYGQNVRFRIQTAPGAVWHILEIDALDPLIGAEGQFIQA